MLTLTMLQQTNTQFIPMSALVHIFMAILGALYLAMTHYVPIAIAHPSREKDARHDAWLIFLQTVIPAPVAGLLAVALAGKTTPFIAGDYRYEYAIAFAGGIGATSIMKRLSKTTANLNGLASEEEHK